MIINIVVISDDHDDNDVMDGVDVVNDQVDMLYLAIKS